MTERPATPRLTPRGLRDELAFLLDSTVDLPADAYDRDTLLMRLEAAFLTRSDEARRDLAALRTRLAAVERERDNAEAALEASTKLIRQWHGMGMTGQHEKMAWEIYLRSAPEMEPIRIATRATPGPVPEERG